MTRELGEAGRQPGRVKDSILGERASGRWYQEEFCLPDRQTDRRGLPRPWRLSLWAGEGKTNPWVVLGLAGPRTSACPSSLSAR